MDEKIAQRYQELDFYLRQSHAERDLEELGRNIRESSISSSLETRDPMVGHPRHLRHRYCRWYS